MTHHPRPTGRLIPLATALGVVVLAVVAQPALARPRPTGPARSATLEAVTGCRKLTDDAARLACYDKAAGALDQAEAQGQVVVIDREQAKAVRRDAFGFNLPSISLFNRAVRDEPVDKVEVSLSGAHTDANGRWVLVTTADQVWRMTESEEFFRDPREGSKMVVRQGALGSYFCKVDGLPAVRCLRER